jgi:hypothetical protein
MSYKMLCPGGIEAINAYSILGYSNQGIKSTQAESMRSWRFQGSNDGRVWMTLDERRDATFVEGTYNHYTFNSAKSFRYYRFEISGLV